MTLLNKAIFIDKDGTLIIDVPYNVDPALIVLSNNCIDGLIRLQSQGYLLIVITNQAGVAKGYFKEDALVAVELKIGLMLAEAGIQLNGFYYCPHNTQDAITSYIKACDCRKPASGMLLKAAKEFNIDLSASWMIGDILNDVEAGNRAGCKSILIDNGNETEWVTNNMRTPTFKLKTIDEAADKIIKTDVERLAEV